MLSTVSVRVYSGASQHLKGAERITAHVGQASASYSVADKEGENVRIHCRRDSKSLTLSEKIAPRQWPRKRIYYQIWIHLLYSKVLAGLSKLIDSFFSVLAFHE